MLVVEEPVDDGVDFARLFCASAAIMALPISRSTSLGWPKAESTPKGSVSSPIGCASTMIRRIELGLRQREHERIERDLVVHRHGDGLALEQPARGAVEGEIDLAGVDAVVIGLGVEDVVDRFRWSDSGACGRRDRRRAAEIRAVSAPTRLA